MIKKIWNSIFGGQYEDDGGIVPELKPVPKPVSKNDLCECFDEGDMKREVAIELNVMDQFYEYIEENGLEIVDTYSFDKYHHRGTFTSHIPNKMIHFCFDQALIDGEMVTISIDLQAHSVFRKEACLTCNSCLGWKICRRRADDSIDSPVDYFDGLIIREIEKQQKIADEARSLRERRALAKKICEVE